MNAKDTVMKELVYDSGLIVKFSITDRDIAETQAEISFEAGIKEVVDWVSENAPYRPPVDGRYLDEGDWQAKLKEWGIDEIR